MSEGKTNEPTAIETALAYLFWAAVLSGVYFFGLKPQGLTVSRAIAWAKGKPTKGGSKREKVAPPKRPPTPTQTPPLKRPPKPMVIQPMSPKKPVMHRSRVESEEDD